MAENFPGPLELRLYYQVTFSSIAINHQQRLNLQYATEPDVGDELDEIDCLNSNGVTKDVLSILSDWMDVVTPMFAASAAWSEAQLWKYAPGTNDAVFINGVGLTDIGSNGGTNQNSGEGIWTFRTQEGGIMRLTFQESVVPNGQPRNYANQSVLEQAVVDNILGGTVGGYFIGRDTSFVTSHIKLFPGQNEAIWRKRYRLGL